MIRTRDFALFLLTVFLLVANIGIATVRNVVPSMQSATVLGTLPEVVSQDDAPVSAEVVVPEELDRTSRLATMKEKVAAKMRTVVAAAPKSTPPPVAESVSSLKEPETPTEPAAAETCASYQNVAWSDYVGVRFKEVEGARLVYREVAASAVVATATAPVTEEVLAQLPMRTMPLATPSCIPQDVIGIATDGSLIRNSEVGLYAVFGEATLVGYALDGFPIYGKSATKTDRCGGVIENGWYRYYVSGDRETILNCFASVPVSL